MQETNNKRMAEVAMMEVGKQIIRVFGFTRAPCETGLVSLDGFASCCQSC